MFNCTIFHSRNPLEICSSAPLTGWFRDGFCRTDENDVGMHTVCATMTQEVNFPDPQSKTFPNLASGNPLLAVWDL